LLDQMHIVLLLRGYERHSLNVYYVSEWYHCEYDDDACLDDVEHFNG